MITATFVRESPEVKLGISLQRVGGFVEITRIKEIGVIFAQTDLRVGNRLLMINNIDCTQMSAEEALVILKTTLGTITILADNSEVPTETAIVKAVPLPLATVTSPREMQPLHPPGKPAGGVWYV
jgi:predicted metalloprotease with PDZ domain